MGVEVSAGGAGRARDTDEGFDLPNGGGLMDPDDDVALLRAIEAGGSSTFLPVDAFVVMVDEAAIVLTDEGSSRGE